MSDQFDEVVLPEQSEQFDEVISPGENAANVHKASQILQEYGAGDHPDLTEEELLPIMKLASQDAQGKQTTPLSRTVHQVGNVAGLLTNPTQAAGIGAEMVKEAGTGIKHLYEETGKAAQDESNQPLWKQALGTIPGAKVFTNQAVKDAVVGGTGKTLQFVGNTLGNATTGTADLITQAANAITGQELADPDVTNVRSLIAQHQMNKGLSDTVRAIGANPDSTTSEFGGLAIQAAIPIGGEAKLAKGVAKTAEGITEAVPKIGGAILEKGAQAGQNKYVQGIATGLAGHPYAGAAIIAEPWLEGNTGRLGGWIAGIRHKIMDASLGKIEGLGKHLGEIPEGGTLTDTFLKDAQSVKDKNSVAMQGIIAKEGLPQDAYVLQRHPEDGTFVYGDDSKLFSKEDREIRKYQRANDNQDAKIKQLNGRNDWNKVTEYATKLGLATAGNIVVGASIGGLLGAVNAQPGDDESAKRMAVMGAMISAPFAPFHASGALREIRMEAGREAFKEAGKDSIAPDHPNYDAHQEAYGKLDEQGKDTIDVANGMLKSMGGKAVIILPKEEFLKMQGGDASKAPGRGFVKDGNIYLNADKMASGVVHHELTHFLPQALGQSAFEIMPDLKSKMEGKNTSQAYKDMESYYNSISPDASKTNIPEEVLAETGRRIMQDMPPELFYGGESGADVLKRWGGKILEKAAPSWYRENNIDPILKTPISKADEAAVRAKLFEIGSRKGQEPPRNAPDESPATTIPPDPSKRATEPSVSSEPPISAPPGAVEALTGLGEKKASAQAKVDAATAEMIAEINNVASEEPKADIASVSRENRESRQIAPQNQDRATNPMLVGPRTDKYGKKSVSGRIFDPSIQEHADLAAKAGLDEANIAKLKELSDKMGETVGIDYSHAPEEGEGRKVAQQKTLAQARIEGAKREKLSKTFVPSWIEFTSGTGKAVVRGFSPDKFYENVKTVFDKYPEVMEGHYSGVNDPKMIQDFQNGMENYGHGYSLAGKPIEGTELTPVKPDPNYDPHIMPSERAAIINALMGDTSAAEGIRKPSPVKLEKRALAKANAPFFDSGTGETNKIRAKEGDMGLEPVSETLRPELIDKIREPNVSDEHTIRPSGAAPESRASLAKAGTPRSDFVASGFFPGNKEIKDATKPFDIDSPYMGGLRRDSFLMVPGVWMTQGGDIIPIAKDHASEAAKLFGVNEETARQTAYDHGMLRVTIRDYEPKAVAIEGKKPTSAQRRNIKDWAITHGYSVEDHTSQRFMPDDFKGKTIEAGEPSWSIRLKELETREWNGGKLTDPEQKELLSLHKQAREEYGSYANWFEQMGAEKDYVSGVFGEENQKQAFMPSPHIEREAERLGLQYKGDMGEGDRTIHIFNDPITKSTISIKADAERGALQEKLRASREKFGGDTMQFMPDSHPDAIKEPAFRLDGGKIISDDVGNHSFIEFPKGYGGEAEPGFVTNSGVFLNRKEAYDRAKERGQLKASYDLRARNKGYGNFEGQLEGETFKEARKDRNPPDRILSMPDTIEPIPAPKEYPNIRSLRVAQAPKKDDKPAPIDFKIGTKGSGYNTPLTAKEVIEFDKWKARYAPKDSGKDYDLRGAFKAGLKPDANGHWPDTFKKPNHPTFSRESVYADATAGTWAGEKFIPAKK